MGDNTEDIAATLAGKPKPAAAAKATAAEAKAKAKAAKQEDELKVSAAADEAAAKQKLGDRKNYCFGFQKARARSLPLSASTCMRRIPTPSLRGRLKQPRRKHWPLATRLRRRSGRRRPRGRQAMRRQARLK